MDDLLAYAGILLAIAAIWMGLERPDLSKPWKAALYALELILLIWSVFTLGWIGIGFFVGSMIVGGLLWGTWLRITEQDILSRAAVSSGEPLKELEDFAHGLRRQNRVFRHIQVLDRARLIHYLAERNRQLSEIEYMVLPVATLWIAYRPDVDLKEVVEDFDRLLRIWQFPVQDSMRLADIVAGSVRNSAGDYRDVLDGLLGFSDTGVSGRKPI